MPEPSLENSLLTPIFDQIGAVIDYTHLSIYILEGGDLALLAYRGPVPASEASLFSFPLARAGGAREVIGNEAPLLIADAKADTPIARSFREASREVPESTFDYIGSWIGLPLWIGGRVMGMLDLAHREIGYYTPQHVSLVQDHVKRLAGTIENAVLYTQLNQRSTELQTLYAVQQAINSQLNIDIALQLVADHARRLTSARQVLIFLLEDATLRAAHSSGTISSQLQVGFRLPLQGSLIGEALETGQPLRCFDAQNDPRLDPAECRRLGIRSLLVVPLVAASRPVGALMATDKVFGAFGLNDERLLSMLAAGAAIGLENARLYRQARQLAALEERDRLSRELHDELAQTLGYLKMRASLVGQEVSAGDKEAAQAHLGELKAVLDIAYGSVREAIFGLRREVAGGSGFLDSLGPFLANYRAQYGLDATLEMALDPPPELAPEVGLHLARIVQEALTNVRRHAVAKKVRVKVERGAGSIVVRIIDDGRGFDVGAVLGVEGQHYGLHVMRERAETFGGQVHFESAPGRGCEVTVYIPVSEG